MTNTQLDTLLTSIAPAAPCHLAGFPAGEVPRLALALSCPWYGYESRPLTPGATLADDDGIACGSASFSLAIVKAQEADAPRTLTRLALAHRTLVPQGILVLDIHPGDLSHVIAKHLTASYCPVIMDGSLVVGVRKPPDHRTAVGTVPRGSIGHYQLPPSAGPGKTWRKLRPTEGEIVAEIDAQEAAGAFRPRTPPEPPGLRPLLPLSPGHLAQALATGVLDGPITLADGRLAVIRGHADKSTYKKVQSPLNSKGNMCDNTTLAVYGERPHLWVRLVDESGCFSDAAATESE